MSLRRRRSQKKFLLSNFSKETKTDLVSKIESLGGTVLKTDIFHLDATHVLCGKLARSEKFLCGLARGKWVLTQNYIEESYRADKFLEEECYEWSRKWGYLLPKDGEQIQELEAVARWRQHFSQTGTGAFLGWRVAVLVKDKQRKQVYKRLIECGSGKVVNVTLPVLSPAHVATQVTHVFVETDQAEEVKGLLQHGVMCLRPLYIGAYLIDDPPPNPRDYVVGELGRQVPLEAVKRKNVLLKGESGKSSTQRSPVVKNSGATKGKSQTKRKGSLKNRTNEEVSGQRGNLNPKLKQKSLLDYANVSAKKIASNKTVEQNEVIVIDKISPIIRPNIENRMSSALKIQTLMINDSHLNGRDSVSPRDCGESNTRFSQKCSNETNLRSSGTYLKTNMPSEDSPKSIIINSSPLSTLRRARTSTASTANACTSFCTGEVCASMKNSALTDIGTDYADKSYSANSLNSPFSSLQTRNMSSHPLQVNRELFTKSGGRKRKLRVVLYNAIASAKRMKVEEVNEFSSVTSDLYPTRVNNGLLQAGNVKFEMSHHMYGFFSGFLGGDDSMGALHCARSCVTFRRYPQARLIHNVMVNILLSSKDLVISNEAYRVLQYIQSLHPPTTPDLRSVYMKAMKPGVSDESPDSYWQFIVNIVECIFSGLEGNTQEKSSIDSENALLLMKFVVSLLQSDHKERKQRITQQKSNSSMLAEIIWSNGNNIGTLNSYVYEVISYYLDSTLLPKALLNKVEIVQQISCLVTMVAELSCGSISLLNHSFPLQHLPYNAALFATRIANKFNYDTSNNVECLLILIHTLQPEWLLVKVLHSLLDMYDDQLIPSSLLSQSPPLDLERILKHYFFMLPPVKQEEPVTPHKKININTQDHSRIRASPLRPSNRKSPIKVDAKVKRKIAYVNKTNIFGETPLHAACSKNNINKVKELLKTPGIMVNVQDNLGWTPLHEACNRGSYNAAYELLHYKPPRTIKSYFTSDKSNHSHQGVNLFLKGGDEKITVLHDAVSNNHRDIVELLLQFGGPQLLQEKSGQGLSAIDFAQTEEMRHVLLSSQQNNKSTRNKLKEESQDLSFSSQGSSIDAIPTEAQYKELLGTGPTAIRFSAKECYKFTLLLLHLIRGYINIHNLRTIWTLVHTTETETSIQDTNVQDEQSCSQASSTSSFILSQENQPDTYQYTSPAFFDNDSQSMLSETSDTTCSSLALSQSSQEQENRMVRRSTRRTKMSKKLLESLESRKKVPSSQELTVVAAKTVPLTHNTSQKDFLKHKDNETETTYVVQKIQQDLNMLRKISTYVAYLETHLKNIGEEGTIEKCSNLLQSIKALSL